MTPTIAKIVLIAFAGLATVVIWQQVLLGRRPAAPSPDAGNLAALQHAYDSVARHTQYLDTVIDSLHRSVDTLSRQKLGYKQAAAAVNARLQKTIEQYARLTRYDTASVGDLRRYLSDSVP